MLTRLRELDGTIVFMIFNVALILVSAMICVPCAEQIEPSPASMFRASLIYFAVVGWQPLVAFIVAGWLYKERSFDAGVRPIALHDSFVAVMIALIVIVIAVIIEAVANHAGAKPGAQIAPHMSWLAAAKVFGAFVTIVAILWLQAIIEELAWRGYVLPRLMRALGAWPGLLVHGLVWGVCYAPLFAVTGGGLMQSLSFVVTAGLMGAVLGWLRLSMRSIYASAASNATLTICAGLPLVFGGHRSLFSAVFGPIGWVPLAIVIVMIAWHRPWRTAIKIPWRRAPEHVN